MPITTVAFIRAAHGDEARLGLLVANLAEAARREPGCVAYEVHQSPDAPALWFFYGNWRSEAAIEVHLNTDHVKQFVQASASLIAGPVQLALFTPISKSSATAKAA